MNAPIYPDELQPTPPHSVETEQAVLGALLLDNDAVDRISTLRPSHFYRVDHRLIYETIIRLIASNRPADVITTFEALSGAGKSEQIGGLVYLNALAQNTPSSANIQRYAEIVVDRWKLRGLLAAADEIRAMVLNTKAQTIDAILEQVQTSLEHLADGREHEPILLGTALVGVVEEIDQQYHGAGSKKTPTGFRDLDHKLNGGMEGGELLIVAGRPSIGKTAFSMGIADHVADASGLPVAVFSLEMPAKQLSQRAVARFGELPLTRVIDGSKFLDGDWPLLTRAVQKISELQVFVDDTPAVTLGHIKARAKAIKRNCGRLGLIVIDYLQLMGATAGENRTQQVGANTRGLKALAKELDCPIILLSQLSRKVEERSDKRPIMSDLRESGDIEQDADIILFLYRDEVYNSDTADRGIAEIIISKQRNGALGRVGLAYIGEQTRFCDLQPGSSFGHSPVRGRAKRGFDE